jgi:hypothetical protein
VVVLAVSGIAGARVLARKTPAAVELPRELGPRAELFARAWATGDYALMRRLTDPVQDRQLFTWYRRNPTPPGASGEADGTRVELEPVPSHLPKAAFRVHLRGRAARPTDPVLTWEERGGTWTFQPAPQTTAKSGK